MLQPADAADKTDGVPAAPAPRAPSPDRVETAPPVAPSRPGSDAPAMPAFRGGAGSEPPLMPQSASRPAPTDADVLRQAPATVSAHPAANGGEGVPSATALLADPAGTAQRAQQGQKPVALATPSLVWPPSDPDMLQVVVRPALPPAPGPRLAHTSSAGAGGGSGLVIDQHCRTIILKVQLGEEPSDVDRAYLRHGCRQG